MNLEEADLSRLIPRSMMDDPSCSAICKALNPFFRDLAKNANLVTAVLSIEKLNSEQCDKLANDLAVPWYLSSFTLQKKKQLLHDSDLTYMNSGTKACLEGVLREFFDDQDLYIEEWYQYGGYENTFRIHSSINVSIQQGKGLALILDDLKRASQALSSVIHGFSLDGGLYIAAMIHEHSHETILASMNDFKNLIFPIYPEIGGAYPFRLVGKDGRVAWKSGNSLVHSSESVLTAYVDSETITFEAKVSSEYEYDELIMCVDGSKVLEFGECSGEIDWFEYTHAFSSGGEHKVEWKFVKNGSANEGNDCCWISNIR